MWQVLFYELPLCTRVFHLECFLFFASFPVLLRNAVVRLNQSLRGQRMRTKIALQAWHCEVRKLILRRRGVRHVLITELGEPVERLHRSIGRIAGLERQEDSPANGFQFFILAIAGLLNREGQRQECVQIGALVAKFAAPYEQKNHRDRRE